MNDDEFLTMRDMAKVFKAPTPAAFCQRWYRDKLKPAELRLIPDPINPEAESGFLWSPVVVREVLAGKRPAFPKKGGKR